MNGFFASLKLESECEQNLDWTQMIEISEAVECGKAPLGVVVLVGEILADEFDFKPLVDVSHTGVEIEIAVELVAVVLDVALEGTGIDFPLVGRHSRACSRRACGGCGSATSGRSDGQAVARYRRRGARRCGSSPRIAPAAVCSQCLSRL